MQLGDADASLAEEDRAKTVEGSGPNIILFTLDTLRADHLSCYGYGRKTSPNIDALAAGGILMSRAYAQCTSTVPSHLSIMTGEYLKEFGIYNQPPAYPLPSSFSTLAEELSMAGYSTAGFMAANFMKNRSTGLGQGFETFVECPIWTMDGEYIANPAINWMVEHYTVPFFMWVHLFDAHAHYDPPGVFKEQFVNSRAEYTPDIDLSLIPEWGDE